MRRILVTGASSGIGLECAREFARKGDRVVAHWRSRQETVEELAREFPSGRVIGVQADLATETGCTAVVAEAGRVDVLVHSAGIWNDGDIRTLTAANLEEMFRTNTFSAYYLAREVVRSGNEGVIVFVGSTAGQRGEPGHGHYAGSKAALWGLVQSLAQELAPEWRVNLVSPGWVNTPMAQPVFSQPGRLVAIKRAIPLHRVAEPEDVAAAVAFLADPGQRHLTGVDLPISGGALLPMPRG